MATTTVRFNDDEGGAVDRAAAAAGLSRGVFVKRAALRAAEEVVGPARAVAGVVRPGGSQGSAPAVAPPTAAVGVDAGAVSLPAASAPSRRRLVDVVAGLATFRRRYAPRGEALRAIRAGQVRVAGVVVRNEARMVDPSDVSV